MIDSCRLRKLEPGLAATYSRPSDLMTSTMKSEPGWSMTVALSGTLPLVVAVWAVGRPTPVWAPAELGRIEVPTAAAPAPPRASYRAVLSGVYVWTSLTILAGTVVASMDSYIVNTSMPRVLGELGQPEFYAWVASAFILAQVVGLAVGGALRDRLGGRPPVFLSRGALGG